VADNSRSRESSISFDDESDEQSPTCEISLALPPQDSVGEHSTNHRAARGNPHAGRGVATALMQHIEALARVHFARIQSFTDSEVAGRFYVSRGYAPVYKMIQGWTRRR
jgi:hypothetical protein